MKYTPIVKNNGTLIRLNTNFILGFLKSKEKFYNIEIVYT